MAAEFNGLRLRAADRLADLERLEDWVAADDAHRGIFTPQHFMSVPHADDPRGTCYALEDAQGVVFYIRISRSARVQIQFPPDEDKARRIRGLFHGMAFLENQLSHVGCEEWIFDTDSPRLKRLAERVLGFTESTHELVRPIAPPGVEKIVKEV